jgi:hypothetical protein
MAQLVSCSADNDFANELHQTLDQWRVSDNALRRLRQALPGLTKKSVFYVRWPASKRTLR